MFLSIQAKEGLEFKSDMYWEAERGKISVYIIQNLVQIMIQGSPFTHTHLFP